MYYVHISCVVFQIQPVLFQLSTCCDAQIISDTNMYVCYFEYTKVCHQHDLPFPFALRQAGIQLQGIIPVRQWLQESNGNKECSSGVHTCVGLVKGVTLYIITETSKPLPVAFGQTER